MCSLTGARGKERICGRLQFYGSSSKLISSVEMDDYYIDNKDNKLCTAIKFGSMSADDDILILKDHDEEKKDIFQDYSKLLCETFPNLYLSTTRERLPGLDSEVQSDSPKKEQVRSAKKVKSTLQFSTFEPRYGVSPATGKRNGNRLLEAAMKQSNGGSSVRVNRSGPRQRQQKRRSSNDGQTWINKDPEKNSKLPLIRKSSHRSNTGSRNRITGSSRYSCPRSSYSRSSYPRSSYPRSSGRSTYRQKQLTGFSSSNRREGRYGRCL